MEAVQENTPEKQPLAPREKGLVAAAAVLFAATIVGFGLWFANMVPADAAGKVNDTYIPESDVQSYIQQYCATKSLSDEEALVEALNSQSMTVSNLRNNAIDQLGINVLVNKRAAELGVTPSDDAVQEQVDGLKSSLAFNDDETWTQTLESYGMTQDQVWQQQKTALAQKAICEKDVAKREATDDETLSYAKSNCAGNEQKQYYRIAFSGDDASNDAYACLEKLQKESKVTLAVFKEYAAKYSVDENAAADGGAWKWTAELDSSSDVYEPVTALEVNEVSAVESDNDEGVTCIYYCAQSYTFPDSDHIDKLKKKDVPSALWNVLKAKAADSLWSSDCSSYLAKMLADAQVTYYPVPADAPYNVDLQSSDDSNDANDASSNDR